MNIILPRNIDHSLVNELSKIKDFSCSSIILDFKKTEYVTLSGSMYLILLCSYVYNFNGKRTITQIVNINENIIKILMNWSFFEQLVSKAECKVSNRFLEEEREIKRRRYLKINSINYSNNLIMPIETILIGEKDYFEERCNAFLNHFHDYYLLLSKLPMSNFYYNKNSSYQKEYSEFGNTLYEIIKNIYDHSRSWGIGGIHSTPKIGTQISFYDLGIGIAQSVKNFKPEIENEKDAINWALVDGQTSKPANNKGYGFTVILDFVKTKNGILSIRTGKWHFSNRRNKWDKKLVNWFPGTQIVIYIPPKD